MGNEMKVKWQLAGLVDGLFKVVAGSDIKAGDEVCICYGGSPHRPDGCGGDCVGDGAWNNSQYLQRYGFVDTSLGTTMVDGKWLVSAEAACIRDALAKTTIAEDKAVLDDGSLPSEHRFAVEYRLHLKRALAAQREAEAQQAKAELAKAAASA